MKLVNLNYCKEKEGLYLGESIVDPKTQRIILNKGHKLTKEMIGKLLEKGFIHVKVDENYKKAVYLETELERDVRKLTSEVKVRLDKIMRLTSGDTEFIQKIDAISHKRSFNELSLVLNKIINETLRNRNLSSMILTLQAEKEGYLFEHGFNTLIYSVAIGVHMNLKNDQLYALGLGALLHDIGKVFIPKAVLDIFQRTDEQEDIYNRYTIIGYELIKRYSNISLLTAHCAYQHRENYDGSGFPRGLKGNDIHLFARIVAVADTYDTLLNPHDDSKPLLPHEAFEVLNGYCYVRFDPEVISAFHHAIAIYPIGTEVTLNTGERAVVHHNNYFAPHRPAVTLLTDKIGRRLNHLINIDLSEKSNQTILIIDSESLLKVQTPQELRG